MPSKAYHMNEMRYNVVPPHCFLLYSRQFNDVMCMHLAIEQLTQGKQ